VARLQWADIELGAKLGEGASGVIHKAHWQPSPQEAGHPVAVKLFKGAVTSDGFPAEEMAACLAAGNHAHLIGVIGELTGHPAGTCGLVMPWIDPEFRNLAGPPNLATCTRDIYGDGQRFSLPLVLDLAKGLAAVGEHLHARGISHGDFYAHNVLYRPEGGCFLGDFGAASFYPPQTSGGANPFEALEVRAFGCLLGELLERSEPELDVRLPSLKALQLRCVAPVAASRPRFAELVATLEALRIAEVESWRRDAVRDRATRLRARLRAAGREAPGMHDGHIVPLVIGDPMHTMRLVADMRRRGFLVGGVRPPTVPTGTSRLRISVSAAHPMALVDALAANLIDAMRGMPK
jgi:serine/threonine protein kinase